MNRSRAIEHLRSVGIMAAWLIGIVIVWRVVLSIDGVQRAGFAIGPWESEMYPMGLPWISFIDAGFLTLLMLVVLSLGRRLRGLAHAALPRLLAAGAILRMMGVLAAVIIGYFAYDDLVYTPLFWQDIGWIYKLAFWLAVALVSLLILLQVLRGWYEIDRSAPRFVRAIAGLTTGDSDVKSRSSGEIILRPRAEAPPEPPPELAQKQPPPEKRCSQCQANLPQDARFCIRCGTEVPDDIPYVKRG